MVMDAPCAGGGMLTGSVAGAYCTGAAVSGALGCSDAPGGAVAFAGGATSNVSVDCPWGTGVVVTSTVTDANPCEPAFGEMIILGFALSLVGVI